MSLDLGKRLLCSLPFLRVKGICLWEGPSACLLLFFSCVLSPGVKLAAMLEAPLAAHPVTTCSDSSRRWGWMLPGVGAGFTVVTTVTLFIPLDFFSHHDQAYKTVLNS